MKDYVCAQEVGGNWNKLTFPEKLDFQIILPSNIKWFEIFVRNEEK